MKIRSIGIFLFLITTSANSVAQNCEVKGAIVDAENQRIVGANILIKGTPHGVVTNDEGEFLLRIPPGKTSLLFAFVDFKMMEHAFLFHKDSCYVLEVKLAPEKKKKQGSISVTSRSVITGR